MATKTATKSSNIPESTVRRVLKMREKGKTWAEITEALGQPHNFILRVRPLMKKIDKKSVAALGPGSKNYGKGASK